MPCLVMLAWEGVALGFLLSFSIGLNPPGGPSAPFEEYKGSPISLWRQLYRDKATHEASGQVPELEGALLFPVDKVLTIHITYMPTRLS